MSLLFEFGLSKDSIKAAVIDSFAGYFQNPQILEKYAVNDLINTWLAYATIKRDSPNSLKYVKTVLDIFNDAKKANQALTIEVYALWFSELANRYVV